MIHSWRFRTRITASLVLAFVLLANCPICFSQDQNSDKTPQGKAGDTAAESGYSTWLDSRGIESTPAGIAEFLDSLKMDEASHQLTGDLLKQLSDEDYLVREKATEKLKTMPAITIASLKSFDTSFVGTTEGRYRLNAIYAAKENQDYGQIQFGVMRAIEFGKFEGLAPSLIASFNLLEDESFVRSATASAIGVTATTADVALLKSTLLDPKSTTSLKSGCLKGLVRIAPEQGLSLAIEIKDEARESLAIEVAKILVANNKLESFDVLFRLLEEKSGSNRFTALNVLKLTTGLAFKNNFLRNKTSVKQVVDETKAWLAKHKDDEMQFQWSSTQARLGRRLISQYNENKVIELDDSGEIIWSTTAQKPFTCLGLSNGHRVVIHYQTGTLIEYDESGKEVRTLTKLPRSMSGMCQAENGNFLIAAGQNDNQVFEIDSKGKRVRTLAIPGTPTSVEVGLNGNLICALYTANQIVEINHKGTIVNRIKVEGKPYHATPLKSGNFLVAFAQGRKIAEYDALGNEIWTYACGKGSYRAQEMDDGTILFADANGIHRINRAGEKIETTTVKGLGAINYMYSY